MGKDFHQLFFEQRDRIFIDIAYSGCGSGCKYCYVKTAAQQQDLASYDDLEKLCDYVTGIVSFSYRIVSFCPHTEPLKSWQSMNRVLFIIRRLQSLRCCFQISTKEKIPNFFWEELRHIADASPIFINVSVPFLNCAEVEPDAGVLTDRIKNIKEASRYPNIYCGLYIKPFHKELLQEVSQYIKLINVAHPDYICVGVFFTQKDNNPCASLYSPDIASNLISKQEQDIALFVSQLREQVSPTVVFSSVCAISFFLKKECTIKLAQFSPQMCLGGICPGGKHG